MSALLQDLRYALRTLTKKPSFAAAAVGTFALGIGANTAIFAVVHAVLVRPLPYASPERLVAVDLPFATASGGGISPEDLDRWPADLRAFERPAVWSRLPTGLVLTGAGEAEQLRTTYVSAGFFDMLGARAAAGRVFVPGEDRRGADRVVALADGLARRLFGRPQAAVGKSLILNGEPYAVAGVLPAAFRDPGGETDLWAPYSVVPERGIPRQVPWLHGDARLSPGATLAAARTQASLAAARLSAQGSSNPRRQAIVEFLLDRMVSRSRATLVLLSAAVGLVLLMACVNLSSLVLARYSGRRRELAVRVALGASRGRLLRQLLTETMLIGVLGGMLGVVLLAGAQGPLASVAAGVFPRGNELGPHPGVFLFAFTLSLACGLFVGILPASRANRLDVETVLREESPSSGASRPGRRVRGALVVVQVALAIVLCAGAALLLRSLGRLEQVRPGLDPERLLAARFTIPASRYPEKDQYLSVYRQILERVESLPGVGAVGAIKILPLKGGDEQAGLRIPGRPAPPGGEWIADFFPVSPGYFRAVGLPLVSGRGLTDADDGRAARVAVISLSAARAFFPGQDAVEKTMEAGGNPIRIVGVVPDERGGALRGPRPTLYLPVTQESRRIVTLVVRAASGSPRALLLPVRRAIAAVDPVLAIVEIRPLEEMLSSTLASPRLLARLLGVFGAAALLLAAFGLYGLLSETLASRRRELALRLALGARPEIRVRGVVAQSGRQVAAGLVLGLGSALAVSRLLRGLLFEVSPTDPWTLATATAALAGAALLATYLPARRASRVNPMEALKSE